MCIYYIFFIFLPSPMRVAFYFGYIRQDNLPSNSKLFEAKWGESNSARGFFRWPGCCFDWLFRRFSCEFCPMVSSFVNLGVVLLRSFHIGWLDKLILRQAFFTW